MQNISAHNYSSVIRQIFLFLECKYSEKHWPYNTIKVLFYSGTMKYGHMNLLIEWFFYDTALGMTKYLVALGEENGKAL